jgi:site-specific recombinase XerD
MLHSGMDMYQLSARLGHQNIAITVDVYSHLLPDAHWIGANHAAKALEELPPIPELDEGISA